MDRLVFQLADVLGPDSSPFVVLSLEEPSVFGSVGQPFACSDQDPPFAALNRAAISPDAVANAGRFLYDALVGHPQLSQYLATALQTQPPQRCPIFVEIATGTGVETLPWETLCSPEGNFLALDERWSIGRVVDGPGAMSTFWPFTPPLRVAAVLSCLGVPAADEWDALQRAIDTTGLEVEVLAVVSEEDLFNKLTAEARGHRAGLEVDFVPGDLRRLQQRIAEFRPHVLHFFCHGTAAGMPHLQVAVKSDWVTGSSDNSLLVEARDLSAFTDRTDSPPWLAVLNCCESAGLGGPENLQSFALRLVYDGAVPTVIGMREPVASDDANLFTAAFYEQFLGDLADRVQGRAPDAPVDWPLLVVGARSQLARKHRGMTLSQAAASTKEWTEPVVYTRPTPFRLSVRPARIAADDVIDLGPGDHAAGRRGVRATTPAVPREAALTPRQARLEIDALRGLLADLPPGTPEALRLDVEARLDALLQIVEQ